ncbi:MAG TPA: serpin family protein [Vicinamibacterales bacterium]|jgi:serpin B|nr:serpin family protein [Vicinamibacterales bacterium]
MGNHHGPQARRVVALAIVVSSVALASVLRAGPADQKAVANSGMAAVVDANNRFAIDLYSALDVGAGNVFFSPFSIATALAMAFEGARGTTADEMQKALHFPRDDDARRSGFAAVQQTINHPNAAHRLNVANALWAQRDYRFLSTYTDIVRRYYGGTATNVDFLHANADATRTIDRWIADKTNDKIKGMFPPGSLSSTTRLVLTNAIYFKGRWISEFDKKLTTDEDFRVGSRSAVKVPLMQTSGGTFKYAETPELQILELPYQGGELVMRIVLPRTDDLRSLEKSLSMVRLTAWTNALKHQRVDVFIPRFTFNARYSLNDSLDKLGMRTAFSAAADLSGMDGTRDLSIQAVIHQAFVDVNEEGTEAAAATGIAVVEATAIQPPVPVFRADHPFVFMIQQAKSGNILFLGRVANPKA